MLWFSIFPNGQVAINWGSPMFGTVLFWGWGTDLEATAWGPILHRKLLGRLPRWDLGDLGWLKLSGEVTSCGASAMTSGAIWVPGVFFGPVAIWTWFGWVFLRCLFVGICCSQFFSAVDRFLQKIRGQMNIHNIHNSSAVKTGVGAWHIQYACPEGHMIYYDILSFSLLNTHLGGSVLLFSDSQKRRCDWLSESLRKPCMAVPSQK